MQKTREALPSSLAESFLLKEHAVAQYLTVSVAKIRVMRRTGEGPAFIRIGKSIRYTVASLQDYISSLSNAPKVVRIEIPSITTRAKRPLNREESSIEPNKASAPKILLQDIFNPNIEEAS